MRDLGTSVRATRRKVPRSAGVRQACAPRRDACLVLLSMIRIDPATPPLTPGEQYGLDVLVDLSCALVVGAAGDSSDRPSGDAVSLRVASGARDLPTRAAMLAGGIDSAPGVVTVDRSVLGAVADVAGAAVEQRSPERDRYGRVPSTENPLVAAGAERSPLVSEAASLLRRAITRSAASRPVRWIAPWPERRRWCAAFTHDIDVGSWWPVFTTLRVAELVRKGERARARTTCVAALRGALGDPVTAGVRGVVETERRAGIASTWFVLCGTPTIASIRRADLTYRPESVRVRRLLHAIRAAGHEIGLHGSFVTGEEPVIMQAQRHRLEHLTQAIVAGVRQHYLRMRPGATQVAMARCVFTYDATYGFPDRNGFRLGVAETVPSWDEAGQHLLQLEEVPLIWMDRAQSKYQGVEDPNHWIDDALALADAARAVNGLWVGLWHPNLTPALGYPGAPEAYDRLVATVMSHQPYVAPLSRIVAWRALRRSVRGRLAADGALIVEGPVVRGFDITIEDNDGRPVATLPRNAVANSPVDARSPSN